MVIAVLDGGFYQVNNLQIFDSLWSNNQILGTKDFVNPYSNIYSQSAHGMKVLSTMGANSAGSIVGTAPKANYWLIRTEDSGSETSSEEDNWIAGAEFADSVGADLINSSLGYSDFDSDEMDYVYADMDGNTARVTIGADIAASKGILVVNSAGNSGNDNWRYIGAPADGDSVFAIGAIDDYGQYVYFSSIGPTADGRTKPDIAAKGYYTAIGSNIGGVTFGNGTSYAAPVITGLLACLWQVDTSLSNMEIIDVVKKTSSLSNNPNNLLGYGQPDFAKAFMSITNLVFPNFDEQQIVNVEPNPFYDIINIKFLSNCTSTVDVEIVDVSGRVIYSEDNIIKFEGYNNIQLDSTAHLAQGLYILKVKSGNNTYTSKIIKNR